MPPSAHRHRAPCHPWVTPGDGGGWCQAGPWHSQAMPSVLGLSHCPRCPTMAPKPHGHRHLGACSRSPRKRCRASGSGSRSRVGLGHWRGHACSCGRVLGRAGGVHTHDGGCVTRVPMHTMAGPTGVREPGSVCVRVYVCTCVRVCMPTRVPAGLGARGVACRGAVCGVPGVGGGCAGRSPAGAPRLRCRPAAAAGPGEGPCACLYARSGRSSRSRCEFRCQFGSGLVRVPVPV